MRTTATGPTPGDGARPPSPASNSTGAHRNNSRDPTRHRAAVLHLLAAACFLALTLPALAGDAHWWTLIATGLGTTANALLYRAYVLERDGPPAGPLWRVNGNTPRPRAAARPRRGRW